MGKLAELLNKELLKLLSERMVEIINHFFPGLFTLFIFFNLGKLSSGLNIYSFIFIVFLSIILTIPYHFCLPIGFTEVVRKFFFKINGTRIDDDQDLKEQNNNMFEITWFKFVSIRLILIFVIHKTLIYYRIDQYSFLNIDKDILNFTESLLIMYLISYPVALIFRFCVERNLEKNRKYIMKTYFNDKVD
jgi:hypothetical protein